MGLLPFGKSDEQKREEILNTSAPPTQQNIDLSGGTDKPAQFGYWEQAQDFTEELAHIKALLEGKILVYTKEGRQTVYPTDTEGKEIKKPFCLSEGQFYIYSFIAAFLQKGTVLSNYSIDTVLDRCDQDAVILNELLYLNMRKWEIDPTRLGAFVEVCMDRIESARRRSVDNEERNIVAKGIQEILNTHSSNVSKAPSLIGGFGGRK